MSELGIIGDAEKMADLFVAVLAKALMNRVLDDEFDGLVTTSQLQALRYLLHNEQQLMSDLAEGLAISYPAATKTVERLVKKGLVAREGDPADRRVVRVRLTAEGVNLVTKINGEIEQHLAAVLHRLEQGDREALLRGMKAFIAAALAEVRDGQVVEAICLHCGSAHKDDCPVRQARERALAQPTAV